MNSWNFILSWTLTPHPLSWSIFLDSHMLNINWALMQENLSSGVCEQQRRRPACASAQSDQHLCYSLCGKYHIWTCSRWNFNFLASPCSCGDWFELALSETRRHVLSRRGPFCECFKEMKVFHIPHMSRDMRFPTIWYVRPARAQTSLRLRAVWSEPLLVAWVFYEY